MCSRYARAHPRRDASLLINSSLLYRPIDGRDHVATEVQAARPDTADWAGLRRVLDQAGFWLWPRRWPRAHDGFRGEFAIAVEWAGRAAVSAGPIAVTPVVNDVIAAVERLVGEALAQGAPRAMSAHLSPAHTTLPIDRVQAADAH